MRGALTFSLSHFRLQGSLCPVWNHEVLFPLSGPFLEPVRGEREREQGQVSEVRVVLKDRSRGLIHSRSLAQVRLTWSCPALT